MNIKPWCLLGVVLSVAVPNIASAYIVIPPRLTIVASPDGSALLRIDPGSRHSKPGEPIQPAQATVFRYDTPSRTYHFAGTFALRNPLAPMTAIISDRAEYIVTCDDWDPAIGCTPNVLVVYRGSGEVVKAWSLEDIFSPAEIARFGPFASNVPIRRWRGEKLQFIDSPKGLSVGIPWARELPWQVSLRLDLTSLTIQKYYARESDKPAGEALR